MRQYVECFKNITADSGKLEYLETSFKIQHKRHNILAYNYRLPEIAAAVAGTN